MTPRRKNLLLIALVAGLTTIVLAHSPDAHAAVQSQGILDDILNTFKKAAGEWEATLKNAARWLFYTLGAISLTWTMGMLALRQADIREFFAEFVKFIMFFGFFLWLLENGSTFATAIIDGLEYLGGKAAGVAAANAGTGTSTLRPSAIVDSGFDVLTKALEAQTWGHPIDSVFTVLVAIGVALIFAMVAINLLILLITSWVLMYAGIFLLGFGGSRWTSDIAINYYKTVLGVAVQILTFMLLLGIGQSIVNGLIGKLDDDISWHDLTVMAVAAIALYKLTETIPGMVAGIISGGSIGGRGGGSGSAAMAALAGMAVGGASVAAGAAMSAGKGAAGAAQAVSAAKQAALASMGGGGGSLGGGGESLGAAGDSKGGGSEDGGGTGNTPLAAASGASDGGGAQGGSQTAQAAKAGAANGGGAEGAGLANQEAGGGESGDAGGGDGGGGSGDSGGNDSGGAGGSGTGGFSPTAGGAASSAEVARRTAAILGRGIHAQVKARMQARMQNLKNDISNTPGGRLASAIREGVGQQAQQTPEANAQETSNDSGMATIEQANPDSEVSAFRDRE